jgi:predicted nuclease of restriction endonuclease-like (RecB) superfamily
MQVPQTLSHYTALLSDIKQRIGQAQTRAILAVNQTLIALYWDIGQLIAAKQEREGWGAAVIPRLAKDLHNELPEEKGYSERNIKLMVQFYREYPSLYADLSIGQQPVAQLPGHGVPSEFGQQAVAQIPWGHNVLLMQKVKDHHARQWYAAATLSNGWSRNILHMQIETAAHTRQGKATNNFTRRLPQPQSDLVQQALKDPYLFDFLTLAQPFHERELETGLIQHLEKFLLELGQGFAYVGRQHHMVVGDKLKHSQDAPTIGLILCQQHNAVIAEYALRGMDTPTGNSTFELTRALPTELASKLPSIEQIERELGGGEAE